MIKLLVLDTSRQLLAFPPSYKNIHFTHRYYRLLTEALNAGDVRDGPKKILLAKSELVLFPITYHPH